MCAPIAPPGCSMPESKGWTWFVAATLTVILALFLGSAYGLARYVFPVVAGVEMWFK